MLTDTTHGDNVPPISPTHRAREAGIMVYRVLVLDADGCHLSDREEDTLARAKDAARFLIRDREYLNSGAVKCEVRDARDRCVYDVFAKAVA